jgi:hypothetical protein
MLDGPYVKNKYSKKGIAVYSRILLKFTGAVQDVIHSFSYLNADIVSNQLDGSPQRPALGRLTVRGCGRGPISLWKLMKCFPLIY